MKFLNGFAWVFTIVGIALIAAHWKQIVWYWNNRKTIDQVVEVGDSLSALGIGGLS